MAQNLFLEKNNPVDFLYLDRQRLASLIGQLSERGSLVGLKSVFNKSQSKDIKASGTVVVAGAEGRLSGSTSESSEETYDPFWTHAYSFLRNLEDNFAVPLDQAKIGSLVKFEAVAQFFDMKIMRNLWEPTVKAFFHAETTAEHPKAAQFNRRQRREQTAMPDSMKLGLEVMKEIPHLINMTFLSPGGLRFWAVVQPDYLTISPDALLMKFGAVIDGLWTVVGIVDGGTGETPEPVKISPMLDGVITAISGIREIMGRPKDHFGLTPVAIYSPLRGLAETEAES